MGDIRFATCCGLTKLLGFYRVARHQESTDGGVFEFRAAAMQEGEESFGSSRSQHVTAAAVPCSWKTLHGER